MRRPPRSTLFPTRRSSDLGDFRIPRTSERSELESGWGPACGAGDFRIPRTSERSELESGWGPACGAGDFRIPRTSERSELETGWGPACGARSEEHTSELQSQSNLVCRPLLEKKKALAGMPQREH